MQGRPFEEKLPYNFSTGGEREGFNGRSPGRQEKEERGKGGHFGKSRDSENTDPEFNAKSDGPTGADAKADADLNAEEAKAPEEKSLEQRVQELEQENEELQNRLLRLQADFDNYRKRMRSEMSEVQERANVELLQKILPVLDNLKRAALAAEETAEEGSIKEGVQMITKQLEDLLEKEGVTPIECEGQPFDPTCHDAVVQEPSDDHPPNTVLEELQKGYRLKDKVLRPSIVKVSSEEGG